MKRILCVAFFAFILTLSFNHLTFAKDYSISSGVPTKSKMTSSSSENTYKFTTKQDGEVYITLDETTGGFSMYLYDEYGEIIDGDSWSTRGNKIVINRDIQKGTYYIKVTPYEWGSISSATYRLKATYPGSIKRNPSTFEPNDTAETSLQVGSGNIYKSMSESSIDQDVYQFTTNKAGEVYISLDETTGGFSMYLYDEYGEIVGGDSWSSAGNKIVINENIKQGTYYVKVSPYEWNGISSAKYRFKATFPGSFKRNSTTFEPNDTAETSLKVASGKIYESLSESSIDRDTYQFTTKQDGEVYITLDNTTAGFSMYLYDENGENIGGDSWSTSGNKIVINENIKKGTYYVKVSPYEWEGISSATYRLKATYAGSINRNSVNFEPNETIETSMPLISNKLYKSNSFSVIDRDVYQFTTNKDGEATITLDNTTGGFSMYLYNKYGEYLGGDSWSSKGNTIKINSSLSKGTYYIRITPYEWDGITNATYRLKATFLDKTPSVNPVYDYTTSITGKAVSNTKVYAMVGNKKIGEATAKNGKYAIKISKQKSSTTINVYTVDQAGNISANKSIKVIDKTPPSVPSVYEITDKSVTITGKAESNAKVYAKIGTKIIGNATAKSGKYTIKISKQKAGTSISLYAVDSSGNKSANKSLKVIDVTAPSVPSLNKVTSKTVKISGKAEEYTTVYVYNKSEKIGYGKVDNKGNFVVKIKAQKQGSTLEVYAQDTAKNKSKSKLVKVY